MKKWTERRLREVETDTFSIDLNMPKSYPPIKARPTEDGGVVDRFHAARKELPDEITVVRPFSVKGFDENIKTVVYVAEDGCDKADGTKASPVATLREALSRAEGKGGAKIIFRGGVYRFTEAASITSAHSGSEKSPLIITSEEGEEAWLVGGDKIPTSAFEPLTDDAMLSRLKPEVRGKVLVCDLPSVGITEYGDILSNRCHLYLDGHRLEICRYPNAGEPLLEMVDRVYSNGWDDEGNPIPWEIGIDDETLLGWQWNDEIYTYGGLGCEYFHFAARVPVFDREKMTIKGDGPYRAGAVCYDPYRQFFFQNVFEELDVPGEYYLDRTCGKLYIYPTADWSDSSDLRLVTRSHGILDIRDAENVLVNGLTVGLCSGTAIQALDGTQVLVQRCRITGTSFGEKYHGDTAITISGGKKNGIIASRIEEFSNEGISLSGGDRKYLIPANNFMQNCIFENPHNRFGTRTGGCGNVISHNYFHNTTMCDSGHNEGVVEYNVIEGGDTEGHDSGLLYIGGGGLSSCANHYRYNYFYDFVRADYGIYFDDLSRGMYAYGNIMVGNGTTGDGTTWDSAGRSYNHHNGGEHSYYNNISIDAGYFAFGGDVSYWNDDGGWQSMVDGIGSAADGMRDSEAYFDRNPTYRDFVRWYDQYKEDIKDPSYEVKSGEAEKRLRSPWYNNYENNLIVRAARPYKLDHGVETATNLETNFITNDDPGFVDFEGKDYRFRPDAEVFKQIPGFVAPPFEKMGPVDDYQ